MWSVVFLRSAILETIKYRLSRYLRGNLSRWYKIFETRLAPLGRACWGETKPIMIHPLVVFFLSYGHFTEFLAEYMICHKNSMTPFQPDVLRMKSSHDPYHTSKVSARTYIFFVRYQIFNQCAYFKKNFERSSFHITRLSQKENVRSSWNFSCRIGVIKPIQAQNVSLKLRSWIFYDISCTRPKTQ
jgi:hypothetical protein